MVGGSGGGGGKRGSWVSISFVRWMLDSCPVRGASARLALVALAERADDDGVCWPGVQDVARRVFGTDGSERQTRRLLRELEAAGELRTIGGGRGPRDTARYIIVAGRSEETIRELSSKLARRRRSKGDIQDRKGDAHAPLKGDIQDRKGGPVDPPNRQRTISENLHRTVSAEASLPQKGVTVAAAYDLDRILRKLNIPRHHWLKAPASARLALILDGCGCDASFRQFLAKSKVDLRIVLEVADEACRRDGTIRNPGGWFRKQLQERGAIPEAPGGLTRT